MLPEIVEYYSLQPADTFVQPVVGFHICFAHSICIFVLIFNWHSDIVFTCLHDKN
ncbi:hypothetical protein [uncultured Gammaproteobacteria bacterium]|nr:hypothetical protein [uncultured Gammaproteobacteria bacterium]